MRSRIAITILDFRSTKYCYSCIIIPFFT